VALESGFRMVKCVLRKYMHIRFSNVSQSAPVFKSSSLYFPVSGDSAKYKCLFYSRLGVGLVRFELDCIGPTLLMNILKYIVPFAFRHVAWKIVSAPVRLVTATFQAKVRFTLTVLWPIFGRCTLSSFFTWQRFGNGFTWSGVHQGPGVTRSTKRPRE
jgi:hypothetical protein